MSRLSITIDFKPLVLLVDFNDLPSEMNHNIYSKTQYNDLLLGELGEVYGNDVFTGYSGNDTINGVSGYDTAIYRGTYSDTQLH